MLTNDIINTITKGKKLADLLFASITNSPSIHQRSFSRVCIERGLAKMVDVALQFDKAGTVRSKSK